MILVIGGKHQGKTAYVKERFGEKRVVVTSVNEVIMAEYLEKSAGKDELVQTILTQKPDVIITDEVGCGIVPMKKEDRELRDLIGMVQVELAKEADEVVRVICGIPQRIK